MKYFFEKMLAKDYINNTSVVFKWFGKMKVKDYIKMIELAKANYKK